MSHIQLTHNNQSINSSDVIDLLEDHNMYLPRVNTSIDNKSINIIHNQHRIDIITISDDEDEEQEDEINIIHFKPIPINNNATPHHLYPPVTVSGHITYQCIYCHQWCYTMTHKNTLLCQTCQLLKQATNKASDQQKQLRNRPHRHSVLNHQSNRDSNHIFNHIDHVLQQSSNKRIKCSNRQLNNTSNKNTNRNRRQSNILPDPSNNFRCPAYDIPHTQSTTQHNTIHSNNKPSMVKPSTNNDILSKQQQLFQAAARRNALRAAQHNTQSIQYNVPIWFHDESDQSTYTINERMEACKYILNNINYKIDSYRTLCLSKSSMPPSSNDCIQLINKHYKRMARLVHPDKHINMDIQQASDAFAKLQASYTHLKQLYNK